MWGIPYFIFLKVATAVVTHTEITGWWNNTIFDWLKLITYQYQVGHYQRTTEKNINGAIKALNI